MRAQGEHRPGWLVEAACREDATADVVLQWAYPGLSQVVLLETDIRDAAFAAAAHLAELTDARLLMTNYYRVWRLLFVVLKSVVPLLARGSH